MNRTLLILFIAMASFRSQAQVAPSAATIPAYYISTDIVSVVESIPNISYERFFQKRTRLMSWRIDAAYQVHYNNQFGLAFNHGDVISIGVYQGPAAKFTCEVYSHHHRKRWMNYFSYGLGVKYLWYNDIRVNTGRKMTDIAYRLQSETCIAGVPQFTIGAKRHNSHFCADFFCGVQVMVKDRQKTISYEEDQRGNINLNVPYNRMQLLIAPSPVLGIKIGFLK